MAPSTPAGETRRDIGFTLFVALLALSPRLYVAIAWPREPVWDGHYYDFGAKRIAEGFGYSDDISVGAQTVWHPWCHYPVGYSAFLGAIYTVFGSGPHVATIANALVGALLVAVVHRLALYATPSVVRARLAALLVALSPGLIVYSALLMTEPLAAFGILSSAWLFVRGMGVSPTSMSAEPSRRIALRERTWRPWQAVPPWASQPSCVRRAYRACRRSRCLRSRTNLRPGGRFACVQPCCGRRAWAPWRSLSWPLGRFETAE